MNVKKTFLNLWVVAGMILLGQTSRTGAETAPKREIVTAAEIETGRAKFDGQIKEAEPEEDDAPKAKLFQEYGTRTFATFKKHPELVRALRKLDPKFDPKTMGTSSPSSIATAHGRTFLILIGCYPHNCGGTEQLVAFEPATKRVYLIQPTDLGPETEASGKFYIYGEPDEVVRAVMYKAYPG